MDYSKPINVTLNLTHQDVAHYAALFAVAAQMSYFGATNDFIQQQALYWSVANTEAMRVLGQNKPVEL
jgi:hypothetical protein